MIPIFISAKRVCISALNALSNHWKDARTLPVIPFCPFRNTLISCPFVGKAARANCLMAWQLRLEPQLGALFTTFRTVIQLTPAVAGAALRFLQYHTSQWLPPAQQPPPREAPAASQLR